LTIDRQFATVFAVDAAFVPSWVTLLGAVLLDAAVRLPNSLHPVAWFGHLATFGVARAPTAPPGRALSAGVVLAFGLPAAAVASTCVGLHLTRQLHSELAVALQVLLLYACVCLFGLLDAARQLLDALQQAGLAGARARLPWLCSRDPSQLDETGLINGAIESLAENLSDSVVAPLFYLCCFGLPGAVAYRAINTLDAMIGYHGRYEWLGKAAARLDDAVNWLPARATAFVLYVAAQTLSRYEKPALTRALVVWSEDHARPESPNGGHPMAMMAGLLGVRLDKPDVYVLGADLPAPMRQDLQFALDLTRRAGALALALAALCLWVLGGSLGPV